MVVNKEEIIQALQTLPGEIHDAELNFYHALNRLREVKNELTLLESNLTKTKKIDGKSDRARALQLIPHTEEKQYEMLRAEIFTDCAKADLNHKLSRFESVKLLAGLIK